MVPHPHIKPAGVHVELAWVEIGQDNISKQSQAFVEARSRKYVLQVMRLEKQARVLEVGNAFPSPCLDPMQVRSLYDRRPEVREGIGRDVVCQAKGPALVFSTPAASTRLFLIGTRFCVDKVIGAGDFLPGVIGNRFVDGWEDYLVVEISEPCERETVCGSPCL
jgi:hypothetical protein